MLEIFQILQCNFDVINIGSFIKKKEFNVNFSEIYIKIAIGENDYDWTTHTALMQK